MTSRDRRLCIGLLGLGLSVGLSGCGWPPESEPPAPFDCDEIDRADERFPEECGDAGVGDAATDGGAADGSGGDLTEATESEPG